MQPFGTVRALSQAGLDGLMLYFAGQDVAQANFHVQQFCAQLDALAPPWLVSRLPSFDSVLVRYDWQAIDSHQVYMALARMNNANSFNTPKAGKVVKLPVWYGAPQTPDLPRVAQLAKLSVDETIALHSSTEYRVYAVGFAPGFAYLGENPAQLAPPRLDKPRQKVPKGAVALADRQSAVYPKASPGGWNLIGLCPIDLAAQAMTEQALAVGDSVRFYAIDEASYRQELSGNANE